MAQKLGQVAVGTIVKINENGSPAEFYVAKHAYESGLNGRGWTLVVRKDIHSKIKYSNGNKQYKFSKLNGFLEATYYPTLDSFIKNNIGNIKIYCTGYDWNASVEPIETMKVTVFQLSVQELGAISDVSGYANAEGPVLPIANTLKIAKYNGAPDLQFTRTATNRPREQKIFVVGSDGRASQATTDFYEYGARPAFVLNDNLLVLDDGTVRENTAPSIPGTIKTPAFAEQGRSCAVSWSASTDTEGNLSGYELEWLLNGIGSWQTVTTTSSLTVNAPIPSSATSVQFRVRARDDENLYSGYRTASTIRVYSIPKTNVPAATMQGQPISVSWSSVDGADSYILQRKADGGEWEQVYAGAETSYTDTAGSWTTVQYQVCGVFGGVNGAFAVSPTIQVLPASALSIAGTDGDLGALTSDVPYSVATNTGKNVTMDIAVNGVNVFHRADATTYTGTLSVLDLPTGMGSIVIAASVQVDSGMVTAERKWTYTKPDQPFPASGGVAALTKDGKPLFPQTLAECVRTIGGPWGGDLGKALEKLARAATFSRDRQAKYTEVKVDLGKVKAGDIVNLPVKGIMTSHIVVQVGNPDPAMYDASCDGVWLLRQDIAEAGPWNASNVNTLAGSTIMTKMQTYVADYDSTVQAAIQTVKIPYCVGNGSDTVNTLGNGLECKVFPLSSREIGFTDSEQYVVLNDGTKLDYFISGNDSVAQQKRVAKLNGTAHNWWLRSAIPPYIESAWYVRANGTCDNFAVNSPFGYIPCFLLPTTFTATYYVDESGAVHPEQEYTNGGDFYDMWGEVIPTVKIATGSYTGTGTYGASNPNTLTFSFEPKVVIITGTETNATVPPLVLVCDSLEYRMIYQNEASNIVGGFGAIELDGNTVKWWSTAIKGSATYDVVQFNQSGVQYFYTALG